LPRLYEAPGVHFWPYRRPCLTGTVSTQWFFADWLSDPCLRASSLAARGLWKDLLCIAAANKGRDYGFVLINGRSPAPSVLARIVQSTPKEIKILLTELRKNGVFTIDARGAIYCRRMVRAQKARKNGRLGGNPKLLETKETADPVNHPPLLPYPLPSPKREERKKEATNGNGVGVVGKRKPRHGQMTKDHKRIWLDAGTDDFTAYAADYWDKHHALVPLLWHESGAWFNQRGESNG
jgi:hypothetical protein